MAVDNTSVTSTRDKTPSKIIIDPTRPCWKEEMWRGKQSNKKGHCKGFGSWYMRKPGQYSKQECLAEQGSPDRFALQILKTKPSMNVSWPLTTRLLELTDRIREALILHNTRCGWKQSKGSKFSVRRTRCPRSAKSNRKLRRQKIAKRFFGQSPFLYHLFISRTLKMPMTTANLERKAAPV